MVVSSSPPYPISFLSPTRENNHSDQRGLLRPLPPPPSPQPDVLITNPQVWEVSWVRAVIVVSDMAVSEAALWWYPNEQIPPSPPPGPLAPFHQGLGMMSDTYRRPSLSRKRVLSLWSGVCIGSATTRPRRHVPLSFTVDTRRHRRRHWCKSYVEPPPPSSVSQLGIVRPAIIVIVLTGCSSRAWLCTPKEKGAGVTHLGTSMRGVTSLCLPPCRSSQGQSLSLPATP